MESKPFLTINQPTPEKQKEIERINNETHVLTDFYKRLYPYNDPKNSKINYNVKYEGKNKGQYGYYISYTLGDIFHILEQLKIHSFLDLGSGAGILLYILNKAFCGGKSFKGYEIEPRLAKIANTILKGSTKVKNILTLKQEDIQPYEALYFWEPLEDKVLAEKFVKNLLKILLPNQIIIYRQSGHIGEFLKRSNKLDMMYYNSLQIYRLKK